MQHYDVSLNTDYTIEDTNGPITSTLTEDNLSEYMKDLNDYPSSKNTAGKPTGLNIVTSDLDDSKQMEKPTNTYEGECSISLVGKQSMYMKTNQTEAAYPEYDEDNKDLDIMLLQTYPREYADRESFFRSTRWTTRIRMKL